MKLSSAALTFIVITVVYVGALLLLDLATFASVRSMSQLFPLLLSLAFASFFLRYLRWYWLLSRAKCAVPFWPGFICYLAGFAFTASPGKVGELLRVRYFLRYNVHPSLTISAFIYERALDLLVVLLVGSLIAFELDFFFWVATSIFFIVAVLLCFVRYPYLLRVIVVWVRRAGFKRIASLIRMVSRGLRGVSRWLTVKDLVISSVLGLSAWLLISFSFVWLLGRLGEALPVYTAIAIYPVAMLVGALSMLPGGIGTTEAAIVMQLMFYDVSASVAALVAVCIRISTLWFAIICGMLSLLSFEVKSMFIEKLKH